MVELKRILNNRTYLMGFACILIMVFHSNLPIINDNIIKKHLYIGVDIFLFLSGIGIAQTLSKNKNKKSFYKSRILKIVPIALPLIAIYSLLLYLYVSDFGIKEFYLQSTLTNFILIKGNYSLYLWYFPTIMIYYFACPYIYNFYTEKENKVKSFLTLLLICLVLIIFTTPQGMFQQYSFIANRLPIYIIGLIYGIRIKENEKISMWELIFICFSAIIGIAVLLLADKIPYIFFTVTKIIAFIPITISFCIIFSNLIEKIKSINKEKRIEFLNIIGKYTLAIYTTHESLLFIVKGYATKYEIKNIIITNPYIYALVIAVVTIVIAIIWTKFINYLRNNKNKEIK